ncbi:type 1 glutamine amidotransferase [Nocardioides donggukensis]|uniref:Type 1 glutamine amidotransferase n=1 Tax=Nocardioides donggukensis TaxID=2774019 RepID=A0A927K699_9ACTN|nr:type 1 glutamine amidotransferase [Nocardioides donggukensis]MBD8869915.1 type 1 glutamine amidotransferase [Nocardioides donggukensis]
MRTLRAGTEALLWAAVGSGALWLFLLLDLRAHGERPGALVDTDVALRASLSVVAVIGTAVPTLAARLLDYASARIGAALTALALLVTSAAWSGVVGGEFLTLPTVLVGAGLGLLSLSPAPWGADRGPTPRPEVRIGLAALAVVLLVYPGLAGLAEAWRLGLVTPVEDPRAGWGALVPAVTVTLACVAALVHLARAAPAGGPRVLVVEHEAACPPAHLGRWLEEAGCTLEVCRPYAGDALPDLAPYDALLVLGGSMGANDDREVSWLGPLRQLVREAVAAEVPTLGVCLGHQVVAAALGGQVRANPRGQQVGLLDVGWLPEAADDELVGGIVPPRRGLHWNSDIVTELPAGAVLLARTPEHEPQVVRYAARAWGIQMHPEVDRALVQSWADGDRDDHLERGIDQDGELARLEAAADELADAWRPMALAFAALAGAAR